MTFKLSIGDVAVAERDLYTNEAIVAVIPRNDHVSAEYLIHALPGVAKSTIAETAIKGATLNKQTLRKLVLRYPRDRNMQTVIADVLNAIDAQIEATEASIGKHERVRQGLLQDLFTRGINPDGELRPTREEAPHLYHQTNLGWLPRGWEVGALSKWVSRVTYGFTNPMPTSGDGPYMVTAADVMDGKISLLTCRRTTQGAFDKLLSAKSKPRVGDILLTKDGTLGRLAIVQVPDICINQSIAVISPRNPSNSRFLFSLLSTPAYQARLIADAGGSTIKHIYITTVEKMVCAMPADDRERDMIVNIYDGFERSRDRLEIELAKLKLLRSGLMQDLLTGRVSVEPLFAKAAA